MQPALHYICAMSKSLLSYFKSVERDQLIKLSNPTGQLTKELPSSVISAANKDITESSKKERVHLKERTTCKIYPQIQSKDSEVCHREWKLYNCLKI